MNDSDFAGLLIVVAVVMFPVLIVGQIVEEIWRWRQRVDEDEKQRQEEKR